MDEALRRSEELRAQYEAGEIDIAQMIRGSEENDAAFLRAQAFAPVAARYAYIKANEGAYFFFDLGYRELFGLADPDFGLGSGVLMLLVLILSLCGVMGAEYRSGMFRILGTTKKGTGRTVRAKLGIGAGISLTAFLLAYLPDMIFIGRFYGFRALASPLLSIPELRHFGALPLWVYIALLFSTRLLLSLCVCAIVCALRNNFFAALAAFLPAIGPPEPRPPYTFRRS